MKTVLNWSSGKDAALAYALLQRDKRYDVVQLLTTVGEEQERVVMHGVRQSLLDMQAARIGLPLHKMLLPSSPDDGAYKNAMEAMLSGFKQQGIVASAFGDIFLEDLKQYREAQLATVGMQAIFPLWKQDTHTLIEMLEQEGIETMIVCVNEKYLGKEFLGRKIDSDFLNDLPANVDPCGENGEFHSFVYNAPYFSSPISLVQKEIVYKQYKAAEDSGWDTGFYFLDIDVAP